MDLIRNIAKYLPAAVEVPLTKLYGKWNSSVALDKRMIRDLIEFHNGSSKYSDFKLGYDEAICLCKIAARINADFWNMLTPKTETEIANFYEIVPYYPFELAYWHMKRGQRRFRKQVVKVSFGDVLDYGGGIGDLCIELANRGLKVAYGDVPGRSMDFAKWLFEKRGVTPIEMIDLGKVKLSKQYDVIICIDVIEHVLSPEAVLEDIARHLRNKGRLIITALNCAGKTERNPMHFRMDFNAEELLNSLGILETNRPWLWIKSEKPS